MERDNELQPLTPAGRESFDANTQRHGDAVLDDVRGVSPEYGEWQRLTLDTDGGQEERYFYHP